MVTGSTNPEGLGEEVASAYGVSGDINDCEMKMGPLIVECNSYY